MLALLFVTARWGMVMSIELGVGDTATGCTVFTSITNVTSPT
jgi:hypothetical protein